MKQKENKKLDFTKARGCCDGQVLKYILDEDLSLDEAIEKGLKEVLGLDEND